MARLYKWEGKRTPWGSPILCPVGFKSDYLGVPALNFNPFLLERRAWGSPLWKECRDYVASCPPKTKPHLAFLNADGVIEKLPEGYVESSYVPAGWVNYAEDRYVFSDGSVEIHRSLSTFRKRPKDCQYGALLERYELERDSLTLLMIADFIRENKSDESDERLAEEIVKVVSEGANLYIYFKKYLVNYQL